MSLIKALEKAGYFDLIYNEKYYQEKLHREQGGKREVVLPNKRRIDLLTSDELIEIKQAKNWVKAIAQIQDYSRFYPNHRKRLHIFGLHAVKNPRAVLESATNVCSSLDIVLTWEP